MNPSANQPSPIGHGAAVDAANPWLGLASFTEDTRAYFFGRDDETAELARRVQGRLLTVLFGQSGLGKTSILRAGLVPRLRPEGYCPVYVRVDYAPDAPPPAEQIKQTVHEASATAGTWTRPGVARAGESLWEFFHHRDDVLRDAAGRPLTPLLIFDQFEEIFTLAQTDDAGRERAQAFIAELADLVENRAPPAIEDDEAAAEGFDFARADYRVLIALREDYLAHLEGLRDRMPSATQNRVRLTRLAGGPALEAVLKPGGGLVSDEVARQIVRFVSGAHDLATAEIEPSLLSLVCRELNEVRLARGEPTISAGLLAGSRDTILGEFYERSLADQPAAVRHFVEDVLLTDSGFRESVAEERVRKAFAAAGAPEALRQLVDRRLLRIEERLDVRRVELTHDVLCGVVKASRDVRREREAAEGAERRAREIEAREAATRRSMWRARILGLGAAILCVIATVGAVFGFIKQRAARTAERHARTAELAARRSAYDSDMNVAGQALAAGNIGRVRDLLQAHLPAPGQPDLRGWEWRYLWAQSRGNAHITLCKKPYEINSLAVSSDGRWLAIGEVHRGGLSVWNLTTKKEVYHLQPDALGTVAAFSPAGPLLAYWNYSRSATRFLDHGVRLLNVATGKTVGKIQTQGRCEALAFSRDGRRLVVATTMQISLWSIPSGKELASFPVDLGGPSVNTRFSVTPDLTRAAWAQFRGPVHVIDLLTGALVWSLPTVDKTFLYTAVAISPDGATLAVTQGNDIRLWDIATHRAIGTLQGARGYAADLVFSADGKRLVAANVDQSIRIWNVATCTCEKVLLGHRSEVWRVALLPEGHTLVSGGKDGTVCLWNLSAAAAAPAYVTLKAKVFAWRFAADSRSVVTFDQNGEVVRWSGMDFRRREVVMHTGPTNVANAASLFLSFLLSRDLHWLAVGTAKGEVTLWDLQRRVRVRTFVVLAGRRVLPLGFFAGDRRLMLYVVEPGTALDRIIVWDLSSGREVQSWPAALNMTSSLAFLPDGRSCVVFGPDGSVVRNLAGQPTKAGRFDLAEGSGCALSPDGRQLAVSSSLGLVRIFDAGSGRTEATLTDIRNAAFAVDYSPDGQRLLVSDVFTGLRLWDTDNWSETLTLPVKGAQFNSVAFSPDGNCIGALDENGDLKIWRAPTWAQIKAAEQSAAIVP